MAAWAAALLVALVPQLARAVVRKPHIFLLYVDDWGWANVGYHREVPTPEVSTPAIDDIVAGGIQLNRIYDPAHPEVGGQGVPRNMTTLPQMLGKAGYWSAFAGKWDIGFATAGHIPAGRGYMSSLGYFFQINDYWTQAPVGSEGSACHNGLVDLWEDDVPATGLNATAYEEVLFENHLHAALDSYAAPDGPRARGQPLFLHYAPHLIHDPYEVPAPWLAKFDFIAKAGDDVKGLRQVYAAMVNYMDTVVGNITAHMKALGLWNDTVVIGISDNGGPIQGGQGANNYPLRSGKFSSFEGGMRVNAFMGGGFLPPAVRGTATTQLMHVADLWGTLADATGQLIADPVAAAVRLPPLDTHSFWHSVVLQNRSAPPRPWLLLGSTYWEASGLKLHNGGGNAVWQGLRYPNASTNFSANAATTAGCDKRGCLYDVLADIGEHVDLAAARPAAMDRMVAARTAAAGRPCDLNSLRGKGTDPRACQAIDARGGYWGPWVN